MITGIFRTVVLLFLAFGLAAPATAAEKLVAAVLSADISRYREAHRSFVRTLAQKGFDPTNTEIILQAPNPDPISWANAVRKFEAVGADIIVTYGAPATLVAKREVEKTPIIFVDVYGPVETGVTKISAMTGRNLCGVSSKVPMVTLIKTAQEFKPIGRLGVLYSSREVGSAVQLQEIKKLGSLQKFSVIEANVATSAALDSVLGSLLSRVDSLYVSECSACARGFEKVVAKASAAGIPVLSQMPEAAEKGAIVSLEVSPLEQGQLAAEYAAKVLMGVKPGQLPIITPKKIDLIVNLRAVKALGLHIPFQGLTAATKILK